MKVTVVGTGYVGLVTGTCLSETGNDVTCVDIDKNKVEKMKKGEVPIYEPDLENLFSKNIKKGRLHFTTSLKDGIRGSSIIFLALPTPPGEDGSADLSYIKGVASELASILTKYAVIIDKSTVPVGTAEIVKGIIKKKSKIPFDVVSNPEFLREGFAVSDFMKPDRIVIGTESKRAQRILKELYEPYIRQGNPIYFMDERSAEMTKYAANSFLATKVSFVNEVANLCEIMGADIDSVRLGIGADERIGKRFLFAGIGYGGSCFPKDVMALYHTAKDNNYDFKILEAVQSVNRQQKIQLVNKIKAYYKNDLKGKKFALWGLAFKPDTDDIREAPALEIVRSLIKEGAKVVAYDPEAITNVKNQYKNEPNLTFGENEYEVLNGADALIIATEWPVFRTPNFVKIHKLLKKPVIFDGRNLYTLESMDKRKFYYESMGRKTVKG